MSRRQYSTTFKADAVFKVLDSGTSLAAVARKLDVPQVHSHNWKEKFIAGGVKALEPARRGREPTTKPPDLVAEALRVAEEKLTILEQFVELLRPLKANRLVPTNDLKTGVISIVENSNLPSGETLKTMKITKPAYYLWKKNLRETGQVSPPPPSKSKVRKAEREDIKKAVFEVLHSPPSDFGFNRTTWKVGDLKIALRRRGITIGPQCIRQVLQNAGYRWRKARVVLTSKAPDYRERLDEIHAVLGSLKRNEGFFSIDEFGPFSVKHRTGKKLIAPDDPHIVQQVQKSKGVFTLTAAIELQTNQVTYFYSKKKDSEEMIKLIDLLLKKYSYFKTIYLSWDAVSWHRSGKLNAHIDACNRKRGPKVKVVPLPAGAQFLNVIEAVFSGMTRAVLHNSDYKSVAAAKTAVDRYFDERNQKFLKNPKRAGNKIWGPLRFGEEFNHKDPILN